jgi:hypothetical protein
VDLDITAAEAMFLNERNLDWTRFDGSGYSRYSAEVQSLLRKGVIEVSSIMAGPFPSHGYCDVWRMAPAVPTG